MTAAGGTSQPVDLARLDALIDPLVRRAGNIALDQFRTSVATEDKGGPSGFDPVTEADRATEIYLRRELSLLFPGTQIAGEEGGTTGPRSNVRWVIDPIDGTKAYVTGMPLWGVLLGLVIDDRPVAGWCRQPYLDETFAAVDGTAWLERAGARRPLKTSATTELGQASMYSTHPTMFAAGWEQAAFADLAGRVRLQRFGGDCYSYCLLALGHIDLVVEANMQPHDILPLIPIVEAAGGVVTGPEGGTPLHGGFIVAAATGELQARALSRVAAARGQQSAQEASP